MVSNRFGRCLGWLGPPPLLQGAGCVTTDSIVAGSPASAERELKGTGRTR